MDKGKDDRIGNLQWYTIHSEFLNRFKDLCTLRRRFASQRFNDYKKEVASRQQYNRAHVIYFINTELQEQELIAGFMHFYSVQ